MICLTEMEKFIIPFCSKFPLLSTNIIIRSVNSYLPVYTCKGKGKTVQKCIKNSEI